MTPNPAFDGHLVRDTEQSALDSVHCSVKQSKKPRPDARVDWRNDVLRRTNCLHAELFLPAAIQDQLGVCQGDSDEEVL